jgi:IS30 family transposase
MEYTHIDENERRRIEQKLKVGKSIRCIAKALDRSVSSISEEVKQGGGRKKYRADRAQKKSERTRNNSKLQCMVVAMDKKLKKYVLKKLSLEWSPELISGRIKKMDTNNTYASPKAIYKFVYSVHGRNVEKYLYSNRHTCRGAKRGSRKVTLDGRTMIDKRPTHIENGEEFGHFEGDFMESGKDGKGSLLHLVERKTRYTFLRKCTDKKTVAVNALIEKTIAVHEPESLTLDNDLSFAKHKEMSTLVDAPVYFCNPYYPWEKGTVENRNRAVRIDLPKKTDLSSVSAKRIQAIEKKLRNRPLKVLDYKTPQEAWDIEIEKRNARKQIAKKSKHATLSTLLAKNAYTRSVRLEGSL